MEKEIICCICGEHISGYGHSAEPVKSGKCCDKCNKEVVMVRVKEFFNAINKCK